MVLACASREGDKMIQGSLASPCERLLRLPGPLLALEDGVVVMHGAASIASVRSDLGAEQIRACSMGQSAAHLWGSYG